MYGWFSVHPSLSDQTELGTASHAGNQEYFLPVIY